MSSSESEEEYDLTVPIVVTKYKETAKIVQKALSVVSAECKPGKLIVELCITGDRFMEEELKHVFKQKGIERGIALPTCISVNECAGYFAPLSSNETQLKHGDMIKIDLGCHLDGLIVSGADTIVIGESSESITGRKADVITAAHVASECAHRLMKPGNRSTQVTEMIKQVADIYQCNPVSNVISHEVRRYIPEAMKIIPNVAPPAGEKEQDYIFEENEVYELDIVMSTGNGKCTTGDERTTVYRRAVDVNYQLKMKASRQILTAIHNQFQTMSFTTRSLEGTKGYLLGIKELVDHQMIDPFPVQYEKGGEYIAQIKFTVLILPTSTHRIVTEIENKRPVKCEYSMSGSPVFDIYNSTTRNNQKKKKRRKKKKKASGDVNAVEMPGDAGEESAIKE